MWLWSLPSHKQPEICALAARLILNPLGTRTRRTEGRLDSTGQCCLVDAVPRPRALRTTSAVETDQPQCRGAYCPFGPFGSRPPVSDFFHDLVVWYVVAHEGRYTRPEAGLFSPKPGVGPLSATISQ